MSDNASIETEADMLSHTTELPDTSRAVDSLAAAAVAIATSPATADRGIGGTGLLPTVEQILAWGPCVDAIADIAWEADERSDMVVASRAVCHSIEDFCFYTRTPQSDIPEALYVVACAQVIERGRAARAEVE